MPAQAGNSGPVTTFEFFDTVDFPPTDALGVADCTVCSTGTPAEPAPGSSGGNSAAFAIALLVVILGLALIAVVYFLYRRNKKRAAQAPTRTLVPSASGEAFLELAGSSRDISVADPEDTASQTRGRTDSLESAEGGHNTGEMDLGVLSV